MENTETQQQPETNYEVFGEGQQKQVLPISYVMYLTMRSQFIDELAKTDLDVLHKWKEYEDKVFMELQKQSIEN